MPEAIFDWNEVNGVAVERLHKPKTAPVPEPIIRQAQRSVDADPSDLMKCLTLEHRFTNPDKAAAFVKFMRKAGDHTIPVTTISIIREEEKTEDGSVVDVIRWKAGKRRGRLPAGAIVAAD